MKISQLSNLVNVPNKTIRYYEDIDLTPKPLRNVNGYREYSQGDCERLIFIRRCRELQIPIAQIKILIQLQSNKNSSCEEVDLLIEQQLVKVKRTISELSKLEQTLYELSQSCSSNIVGDCQILKNLHHENSKKSDCK